MVSKRPAMSRCLCSSSSSPWPYSVQRAKHSPRDKSSRVSERGQSAVQQRRHGRPKSSMVVAQKLLGSGAASARPSPLAPPESESNLCPTPSTAWCSLDSSFSRLKLTGGAAPVVNQVRPVPCWRYRVAILGEMVVVGCRVGGPVERRGWGAPVTRQQQVKRQMHPQSYLLAACTGSCHRSRLAAAPRTKDLTIPLLGRSSRLSRQAPY